MSLPKIDVPVYTIKVPSTGKRINIRPLTVKEEKILLLAQQSNTINQMLLSIKQIVNNCIQTPDVDINKLAIFDVEYIFLQLRSKSVSNIASVSYRDKADSKVYSFDIDLEQITVDVPKKPNFKLKLTDTRYLMLKYPTMDMFDNLEEELASDQDYEILGSSVLDKLYDGDEVYEFANYELSEIKEFIEGLDLQTFNKIKKFIESLPTLQHTIEYVNEIGDKRKILLKGIGDFFL